MKILDEVKLDFQDVLLLPKRSTLSSRSEVDLVRTFKFKHSTNTYSGIPILAANMDHTGTMEMAKAFHPFQMGVALHKFYDINQLISYFSRPDRNPHTFYSMGIADDDYIKFKSVMMSLDYDTRKQMHVCVDIANGYSKNFINFISRLREQYEGIVIMAGNVVTGDMVYDLLSRGADIVKVGIGPGSVCTTRKMTGVGYPQLSAILECADAAHGAGGLICGDGGITCPGDVAKAVAAGADFVMCGNLFAGHYECNGELINREFKDSVTREFFAAAERWEQDRRNVFQKISLPDGRDWVLTFDSTGEVVDGWHNNLPLCCYTNIEKIKMRFYGMSSTNAMNKHYGGKANYRASEGKVVEIPFKGYVKDTVEEILGGIRSACTYTGARRLKDLPKVATFVKTNRQLNSSLDMYNL